MIIGGEVSNDPSLQNAAVVRVIRVARASVSVHSCERDYPSLRISKASQ